MTRKPSKANKAAAKKKPTPKPKSKPAAKTKGASPAKKAKKPEKPLPMKKAAAPAPPAKAAAKAKPAGKPAVKTPAKPKAAKAPAAKKKPVVMPTGVAKPGLGHKWACFNCGAKFYDLGKPIPVCPKCEADQRDRPAVKAEPAPAAPSPKRPAMAPMSRFLDDDEVAAPEATEEFGAVGEEAEEPEAAEIDLESLEEPGGAPEEFSEVEEE